MLSSTVSGSGGSRTVTYSYNDAGQLLHTAGGVEDVTYNYGGAPLNQPTGFADPR